MIFVLFIAIVISAMIMVIIIVTMIIIIKAVQYPYKILTSNAVPRAVNSKLFILKSARNSVIIRWK